MIYLCEAHVTYEEKRIHLDSYSRIYPHGAMQEGAEFSVVCNSLHHR